MVKRLDLDKDAKDLGYEIKTKGGNHDKYIKGSHTVPVPRKREIRESLARDIRKQLRGKGRR